MSKSEGFTTLIVNMIKEWKWIMKYAKKYRLMCFIYILFGFISDVNPTISDTSLIISNCFS